MELIVLSFIRLSLACSRRSHSIGLTARRGRPRPATSRRPALSLSSGAISRRACPRATPNRWQSTPLQSGKAAQVSCRYVTAWPQPHAPARGVHEAGAASLSIWDETRNQAFYGISTTGRSWATKASTHAVHATTPATAQRAAGLVGSRPRSDRDSHPSQTSGARTRGSRHPARGDALRRGGGTSRRHVPWGSYAQRRQGSPDALASVRHDAATQRCRPGFQRSAPARPPAS
uniref:Uncharacterized protein n=1 Tax=Triticum urartu TaxID=4572 RepID=A0A8R7PPT8_TRIUA